MVEFFQMAELMDDYIILQFFRKMDDFIIKVQVSILGTASPSGLLVPDRNSLESEIIDLIEG